MSESIYKHDYNELSFVIRGDTELYRKQLKKLGGRWNPNLKGGSGWIFSKKKHTYDVDKWMNGIDSTPIFYIFLFFLGMCLGILYAFILIEDFVY